MKVFSFALSTLFLFHHHDSGIHIVRADDEQAQLKAACQSALDTLYANETLASAMASFRNQVSAVYTIDIAKDQLETPEDGAEDTVESKEEAFCRHKHYTYSCDLDLTEKHAAVDFTAACEAAGGTVETFTDGSFNCFDDDDFRYILNFDSTLTCVPPGGECNDDTGLDDAEILRFSKTADLLGDLFNDADCEIDDYSSGTMTKIADAAWIGGWVSVLTAIAYNLWM